MAQSCPRGVLKDAILTVVSENGGSYQDPTQFQLSSLSSLKVSALKCRENDFKITSQGKFLNSYPEKGTGGRK